MLLLVLNMVCYWSCTETTNFFVVFGLTKFCICIWFWFTASVFDFSDQSVDTMLRLPNTSPNTEAVVHMYSIKQLFWKLWKKPRSKPMVECYANKVADFCSVISLKKGPCNFWGFSKFVFSYKNSGCLLLNLFMTTAE